MASSRKMHVAQAIYDYNITFCSKYDTIDVVSVRRFSEFFRNKEEVRCVRCEENMKNQWERNNREKLSAMRRNGIPYSEIDEVKAEYAAAFKAGTWWIEMVN